MGSHKPPSWTRFAGTAAAFFGAGPLAAGIAALAGPELPEFLAGFLTPKQKDALAQIPKAIAGNIGNLVSTAAWERSTARSTHIQAAFAELLSQSLAAVRQELTPEDEARHGARFDIWRQRLETDGLALVHDESRLREAFRAARTNSEPGGVLIDVLLGLDADGVLNLNPAPVRDALREHLINRLPVYIDRFGPAILARHEEAWREVIDVRTAETLQLVRELHSSRAAEPPPPDLTPPAPPAICIDRPAALDELRRAVLSARGGHIALTAFAGIAGVGKTVLAQILCEDPKIRAAFPDGVFWFTVGRESAVEPATRARDLARLLALNTDGPGKPFREAVRDVAMLVVLDDVWSLQDVEALRAVSPASALLFTTRDTELAANLGALTVEAQLLAPEEARRMLAQWAGSPAGALPAAGEEIVSECAGHALALSMLGAALRGKPERHWQTVLGRLRDADLEAVRRDFGHYRYKSLSQAFAVGLDALEDHVLVRRYLALAVLLEDMPARLPILRTLWNVDEAQANETAETLIARSLACRHGDDSILLHDLQLKYVRSRYGDREALHLIHGAVRLSAHVIESDPMQFASQVVGRLLPYRDTPAIRQFTDQLSVGAPAPWLRPLHLALHPPGTALIRTLEGHSEGVTGVAMTRDGRRAVSASDDKTLKVWDLETGRALHTLEGHSDGVDGVAVTGDGRHAVSACADSTLKVWDLETGRALRTLQGHTDRVNGVTVTWDGRRAVSASRDRTLKVWDLETGSAVRTLEGHSAEVNGVAVTGDGRRAVSASYDDTLKVWDLETGRALHTLEGHSSMVAGVAVTGNGRRAVSASYDNTLKVWDLETGRALHTLEGHSSLVTGVAVTGDGWRAVSTSWDKTLKVWDLETGRALHTLEGHSSVVAGVAVTGNGRRAVSASEDHTLKVWDLETGRVLHPLEGHSAGVDGVAVTRDGRRAVSASGDHTLKVWDLETGRALHTLEGHSSWVNGVAVTRDGRRAVSSSVDKTLKVWDLETGHALHTLEGHSSGVTGVAVTWDGRRAVSASEDKTLKVWGLETGRVLHTLEGHSSFVNGVAVTRDGRRAVSSSWDHTLKVWDLETGRVLHTLEGHSSWITGVAATPDGRRAVSASYDHTLKVWDLETGCVLHTLEGHSDRVSRMVVTQDGRRAVSASYDHTLKVWDLETGLLIATFHCDADPLCCTWVDGRRIVAGDVAGRVYFLSLEEETTAGTLKPRI